MPHADVVKCCKCGSASEPAEGSPCCQAGLQLGRDLAFPSDSGSSMDTMRLAGPRRAARRHCPYYYLADQWRPRLSPAGSARKKDTKAAESE